MPVVCRSQRRSYLVIMRLWWIFESPVIKKLWKGYGRDTQEPLRKVLKVGGVGLRKNVSNSLYHIVGPVWCPDISACCFDHVVFWLTLASYSHYKNRVGTWGHTPTPPHPFLDQPPLSWDFPLSRNPRCPQLLELCRKKKVLNLSFKRYLYNFYCQSILVSEEYLQYLQEYFLSIPN